MSLVIFQILIKVVVVVVNALICVSGWNFASGIRNPES